MNWSGGRVCNLKPGALVSRSGRSDCVLRSLNSGAGTPGPSTELGPDVSCWFLALLISDSLLPIVSISQSSLLILLAASLARRNRNIWPRRDALLGLGEQFQNLYTSAGIAVETGDPSSYMPMLALRLTSSVAPSMR